VEGDLFAWLRAALAHATQGRWQLSGGLAESIAQPHGTFAGMRRSEGDEVVLTLLKIGMTAYRATQSCFSRAVTDVAAGGIAAAIVIRRTRISTYDGSAHRG
jgi:hypothetical protein